jgi:mono/diheme cytochrome c family protein
MSNESLRQLLVGCGVALVLLCATRSRIWLSAQQIELPAGNGADIVQSKCLNCHQSDLIRQQRLTRSGWERELDKMVRWGAAVIEQERDVVLDYLALNWGLRPADPSPSDATRDRGAQVFQRACLSCHHTDIVEQQRLSPAGWVREVDKMVRWGAAVRDEEKNLLVEYLSTQFGRLGRRN